MSHFEITLLVVILTGLCLATHYLDAKFNWRLADWFNGTTQNPFNAPMSQTAAAASSEQEETIRALKERIQVLEAIVTEPGYELNQKINALK